MTTDTITEQQVKDWMITRFNECAKIARIGPVQFAIVSDNFGGEQSANVRFRAYSERHGHGDFATSTENAIYSFRMLVGDYTPQEQADKMRAQAAQMLAAADKLETQSATL